MHLETACHPPRNSTPSTTLSCHTGEDDDWFCQTCDCRLEILDIVNEEFGTNVEVS